MCLIVYQSLRWQDPSRRAFGFLVIALLLGGLSSPAALAADEWTVVDDDEGVVVSVKVREGGGLPVFRGKGMVRAPILDIVAVLHDPARRPDWLPLCIETRLLQEVNPLEYLLYERIDAPWPVNDRDIVLRSRVQFRADSQTVQIDFHTDESFRVPPVRGVTRMQSLRGFFLLKPRGDAATHVTYQIDTHPGGSIPAWMVEFFSEDTPRDTIVALRHQVQNTRKQGVYADKVAAWGHWLEAPTEKSAGADPEPPKPASPAP
jgi:hypothetical protein